jgi:hypothetical protein
MNTIVLQKLNRTMLDEDINFEGIECWWSQRIKNCRNPRTGNSIPSADVPVLDKR